MAGTVTHHKFGEDVITKLSKEIPINHDLFCLANQGHDLGFFSKWYNLKLRNETHKFALEVLQDKNFLEYIFNYINYIKINNLENNTDVKNFLYGYIAHHYLDSFVHPFIIYNTGEPDKNKPETFKYIGKHCLYESKIDKTFLEQYYNYSSVNKIFPKNIKYDKELIDTNNFAFSTTYNNLKYGQLFVEALNDIYSFMKIFRNDPIKVKRDFYRLIDSTLKNTKSITRYEFLSFYLKPTSFKDLTTPEIWYDPTNNIIQFSSFMGLYERALKLVVGVIETLEDIITDKNKDAFYIYEENIPNKSAIHGHECNKNLELKYFKY